MNLLNFLKEDNGNESSMRLLVAFIVVMVIATWGYVSITTKTIAPLQWEQVGAVLGALIAKGWQKGKEATNAPTPPVV